MSPPRDVVKGNMVTFTCSSDARPPVKGNGYSLYKDGHLFSSGQSHNISVVQPTHSGRYHCQAWNDVSRGGSSSPEVLLHVQCTCADPTYTFQLLPCLFRNNSRKSHLKMNIPSSRHFILILPDPMLGLSLWTLYVI